MVGAELGGGDFPALVISNPGHFDLAALAHDKQALSFNSSYRTHLARGRQFLYARHWPRGARVFHAGLGAPAKSVVFAGTPSPTALCHQRSTSALQRHIRADYMYWH